MMRFERNDKKTTDSFKPLIINGLAKCFKNALFRKEILVDGFRANLRAGKHAFFLTFRYLQSQVSATRPSTKITPHRPMSLDGKEIMGIKMKEISYLRSTKQIKTSFICFCSHLFVTLQQNNKFANHLQSGFIMIKPTKYEKNDTFEGELVCLPGTYTSDWDYFTVGGNNTMKFGQESRLPTPIRKTMPGACSSTMTTPARPTRWTITLANMCWMPWDGVTKILT